MKSTYLETRYGMTHVLEMGPEEAKPLILLQGGNCINPMTLQWFSPLFNSYRIIAPDTIGHPGRSEETRISAKDNSFANWIKDIQDYYGLSRCAFIGPSYGGGIILRLATYIPDRIACSILVAPAGIKLGSKVTMIRRVLLPLLAFKLSSSTKALDRIAHAMSLGHMSKGDMRIMGEIFQYVKLEQEMPKITSKEELAGYLAPTMVIGGKQDMFFPGDSVVLRASEIIPNLAASKVYDCGHFPSEQSKQAMNADIQQFLIDYY